MKLYIEEPKTESLEAFLIDLFSVDMDDRLNCKITYLDEECTEEECHAARRSLEDITAICQTYFPDVTDKEIINFMYSTRESLWWRAHWCSDIYKMVFIRNQHSPAVYFLYCSRDENIKGSGKYSKNELEALIDIPQTA